MRMKSHAARGECRTGKIDLKKFREFTQARKSCRPQATIPHSGLLVGDATLEADPLFLLICSYLTVLAYLLLLDLRNARVRSPRLVANPALFRQLQTAR